jgi:phosphohistidine phosphatase SixA
MTEIPPHRRIVEPKARTFVVLRHGPDEERDGEFRLTEWGQTLALGAARNIRLQIGGGPLAVYSSERLRALDTAEVIGKCLGVTAQTVPWLHNRGSVELSALHEALRELPGVTVIMVTHQPQVDQLAGVREADHCVPYLCDILV